MLLSSLGRGGLRPASAFSLLGDSMKDFTPVLSSVSAVVGVVGGVLADLLGGADTVLYTLLIFMVVDWALGVVVSIVFKKSTKTESGGYSSAIGFKGLVKKCVILLMVIISAQLDRVLNVTFIRTAVCFAYAANELASIIENVGLTGVAIPAPITKAIDLLKNRDKEGE